MKLRIYIATTNGPSEIQSLVEEDPDISSVVCLNGTTQSLPITPGYDAFVRKPTGVIERMTGHRVYRLDVSDPITNGESWQLGVYLAHALAAEGRLAQRGEPANGVLFVTGAVNARDLGVEKVGHMVEKLDHTGQLMMETAGEGLPLTIFLPKADLDQALIGKLPPNVDVFAIENVSEALDALQMGVPEKTAAPDREEVQTSPMPSSVDHSEEEKATEPPADTTSPSSSITRYRVLLGLGLILIFSLAAFGYRLWDEGPRQWQEMAEKGQIERLEAALNDHAWPWLAETYREKLQRSPQAVSLALSVRGLRPADGKSCAGMRFRNTSLKAETLKVQGENNLRLTRPDRLCRLEFELTNRSGATRQIWSSVIPQMSNSRFRDKQETMQLFTGELESGESVVLPIRLPLFRSGDLNYTVTALSFDQPSEEISSQFYAMVENPGGTDEVFEKYRSYGLTMIRREIPVTP
ncbi:hypothetical protein DFP90_101323 [Aestuariispira insulae]|uniref:Uncharacterized protein n=2 Tax=Aestuariispira insulae TaxID=1461337 RepID=A0A3D9HVL3_9PROT|nr:hypothetical protein DFP90_101323 [Aestuariispira insulae]